MKQYILMAMFVVGFAVQAQSQTRIGIEEPQRAEIAHKLNVILADEYVLFTKLFNYHWNVTGMAFGPLHNLFQEQYEQLFKLIDKIAERIRSIDERPIATLKGFTAYTHLQEDSEASPNAKAMIEQLVADYQAIIRDVRHKISEIDEIGDPVTSNFLQEIVAQHEKAAWMLRAHLA